MTMIKTATPKAMPKKEKIEIIFKKPSFLFGLKYLKAIFFPIPKSNYFFLVVKIFIISFIESCLASLSISLNSNKSCSEFLPKII